MWSYLIHLCTCQKFLFHRLSNLCLHNWPKLNMPYIYDFSVLWQYSWSSPNGEKCHLIIRYIHTYTYLCHRPESGLLSSPSHIHLFSVLLLKAYNVKDTVLALSFKKSNVNWPTHPSLPEMYITAALIFLIVQ